MKASLDTNVIIHLYRANKQEAIFSLFTEGVFVDAFIYEVELKRHGTDVIDQFNDDIDSGKITLVTDGWLKERGIYSLYKDYFDEERQLYFSSDLGEVHAIALARTLGAVDLVTDDTKVSGPHRFLMELPESDIMPFAYYEILILLFLLGKYTAENTIDTFYEIRKHSPELSFEFNDKLCFFVKRFMGDPYSKRERTWFYAFCKDHGILPKAKLRELTCKLKECGVAKG